MAGEDSTLAARWHNRLKDNPVVAGLMVLGTLIAVVTPVWTPIQTWIAGPSARTSAMEALSADRDTVLVPVRNALRENKALYELLSSPLYHEPGWGIQESYYERVRRDGPDRHEGMRHQIDSLVRNNNSILAKLDGYMGRAQTAALKEQEQLFREHARLYGSRWAGMKAAAIAGEARPIAEPVFPVDFPGSVEKELAVVEKLIAGGSGR